MLARSKIHLSYFASVRQLENYIDGLRAGQPSRVALVSDELPLISNLSLKQNCALILQYHRGFSTVAAHAEANNYLALFGLQHKADWDYSSLHEIDLFIAKLIRAALLEEACIVVDRPYEQLHANFDMDDVIAIIEKLADHFRECHILEYQWEEDRYHGLRRVL